MKRYATANNIPYVDYYPAMADAEKGLSLTYSDDGVHPNKALSVMEPLVENTIQIAL
jgi:lysophospholipase L1-like esterase